ncbi:hypothetical protein LZ32DRAFT_614785 [Colletotrichum eremochloae]|nr:hypothetical protein LZ32DRAFT_614785 [Colletotrichum eremochloae]
MTELLGISSKYYQFCVYPAGYDPFRELTDSLSLLSLKSGSNERRWVVDSVLLPILQATDRPDFIKEDDDCFAIAGELRDEYKIPPEKWLNFVRLLCGCRQLPLILLQNPSNYHWKSYEEMIQCYTIDYISQLLKKYSLSLEQVSILDVCSLFSDDDLKAMDDAKRWKAIQDAYNVTEKILASIKPKIIISCQCVTLGTYDNDGKEIWKRAENKVVRQLCSKVKDAKEKRATLIDIQGHGVWVIKGFHPRHISFDSSKEPVLEGLFEDVFEPCRLWRNRLVVAKLRKMIAKTTAQILKLEVWRSELEPIFLHETLTKLTSNQITELARFRDQLKVLVQDMESAGSGTV